MGAPGYCTQAVKLVETEREQAPLQGVRASAGSTRRMMGCARTQGMAALAVLVWTCQGQGEELVWRPAKRAETPTITHAVSLGQPEVLRTVSYTSTPEREGHYEPLTPVNAGILVRGQSAEPAPPPPPPPPPGFGGAPAAVAGPNPAEEAYNCGVANTATSGGGFLSKFCDKFKGLWGDVTGGAAGRTPFQSDHHFDVFASPVSNPFYFEDPRALTEVRPLFFWQHTPSSNPIYAGGNNFFLGTRASVAFTDWLSLTVDEFGLVVSNPRNPQGDFQKNTGLSELHLGPKVTFIRNETSGTVAAFGLIFEVPIGSGALFKIRMI